MSALPWRPIDQFPLDRSYQDFLVRNEDGFSTIVRKSGIDHLWTPHVGKMLTKQAILRTYSHFIEITPP